MDNSGLRAGIVAALLVVLVSTGCGSSPSEPSDTSAAIVTAEPTDGISLPPDGWYLNVTLTREGTAAQANDAEAIARLAAAAGFSDISILPNPGLPVTCMGEPCEGLGVEPGSFTTVVLKPVDGPDLASPETTWEDLTRFRESVREPQAAAAQAAGISGAEVNWLPFSNLNYLKPSP